MDNCTAVDGENIKSICGTRNRKHRRAAAKPAACAKHLMLSTEKGKEGVTKGGTVEGWGRKEGRERKRGRR